MTVGVSPERQLERRLDQRDLDSWQILRDGRGCRSGR